jgi:hypothetical protein
MSGFAVRPIAIGSSFQPDPVILGQSGQQDPMLLDLAEPPDIFNFIFLSF